MIDRILGLHQNGCISSGSLPTAPLNIGPLATGTGQLLTWHSKIIQI